ncbi:hypothetical protein R3P38DRAFT_3213899 [Favolaschia claudopus]|uniref:Uncharacterized protein n=1 Tax=Favolaschia claudopus TaxID=2862362 RepID=A0AAW0ACM7_9AGAR
MSNITQPNSITRPPVLPLFWFTDERIRFATERPGEIPTKKHTPLDDQSADKIFLVHIPKLSAAWGDDESVDGISVHTWVQASENFGKAIDRLSAAPDAANPHSYGVEFAKHRSFFLNLNDFEADFADWCQIEKKLRNELFNGTAFDVSYWTGQVSGVVNAVKAARMVHSGTAIIPSKRLKDLRFSRPSDNTSTNSGSSSSTQQHQRASREDSSRSFRDSSFRPRERDNGWQSREQFQRRAPTCLVCTEVHTAKEHPRNQTDFKDRKPCFSMHDGKEAYCAPYGTTSPYVSTTTSGTPATAASTLASDFTSAASAERAILPSPATHNALDSETAPSSSDEPADDEFLGLHLLGAADSLHYSGGK